MESTNKTWTELMTPLSQFWLESSSQAWKNWFDLMAKGGAGAMMGSAPQSFESLPNSSSNPSSFMESYLSFLLKLGKACGLNWIMVRRQGQCRAT